MFKEASINDNLQRRIGYRFKKKSILTLALTHKSATSETPLACNERLEFLGDAVLELCISNRLFRLYPNKPEGWLARTRSAVVCQASLAKAAMDIHLGDYLILGKGEDMTHGRDKPSILADAFEALIGAVYIDGGQKAADGFILRILKNELKKAAAGEGHRDFKTDLQEALQTSGCASISYKTIKEEGPAHDKVFTVKVSCNGKELGRGVGKSKKEAEQEAAKSALVTHCHK
ncbi:MAG: ribonuclease III [Christensenellales bacterium]|jgi:ribonuclease-3